MKQHIVIAGGNGAIGRALQEGFRQKGYFVDVIDRSTVNRNDIVCDATDYVSLCSAIPNETDCLVGLTGVPVNSRILVPPEDFDRICGGYLKSVYNLLWAAQTKGIRRVVLASSNHAADEYETNGESALGRPITTDDYPVSKGLYGVFKLACENISRAFFRTYGLSVINLRIGSYRADEQAIFEDARYQRTWISKKDLIDIFCKAVETEIPFGVYYAVSDNPGRPWDIASAIEELGFAPSENAADIIARLQGNG